MPRPLPPLSVLQKITAQRTYSDRPLGFALVGYFRGIWVHDEKGGDELIPDLVPIEENCTFLRRCFLLRDQTEQLWCLTRGKGDTVGTKKSILRQSIWWGESSQTTRSPAQRRVHPLGQHYQVHQQASSHKYLAAYSSWRFVFLQ